MSPRKYRIKKPQLCNWSTEIALESAIREKTHEREALLRENRAKARKLKLESFSKDVLAIFKGTPAYEELEVLDKRWEKINYNKEIPNACIQIKNVLLLHRLPRARLLRYNAFVITLFYEAGYHLAMDYLV